MPKLICAEVNEICAEVLGPKFTRAEVRLPVQQLLSNKNLLFTRKHESVWKYQMELLSWNCHYQLGDTALTLKQHH